MVVRSSPRDARPDRGQVVEVGARGYGTAPVTRVRARACRRLCGRGRGRWLSARRRAERLGAPHRPANDVAVTERRMAARCSFVSTVSDDLAIGRAPPMPECAGSSVSTTGSSPPPRRAGQPVVAFRSMRVRKMRRSLPWKWRIGRIVGRLNAREGSYDRWRRSPRPNWALRARQRGAGGLARAGCLDVGRDVTDTVAPVHRGVATARLEDEAITIIREVVAECDGRCCCSPAARTRSSCCTWRAGRSGRRASRSR